MKTTQLASIAETFGTPTFVYDATVISQQYQKLYNAFQPLDVKLHYAMKALSNINVLRLLKSEGAGLDAVSIQEVRLGLYAGFDPKAIMYTPNCVSFDEIRTAVELGVHVNLDNLNMLEKFGSEY